MARIATLMVEINAHLPALSFAKRPSGGWRWRFTLPRVRFCGDCKESYAERCAFRTSLFEQEQARGTRLPTDESDV